MTRVVLVLSAVLGMVGMYGWNVTGKLRDARAEVAVLEGRIALAQNAARVAMKQLEAEAEKAKEYEDIRRFLIEGDTDAPLPPDFRTFMCRLGVSLC